MQSRCDYVGKSKPQSYQERKKIIMNWVYGFRLLLHRAKFGLCSTVPRKWPLIAVHMLVFPLSSLKSWLMIIIGRSASFSSLKIDFQIDGARSRIISPVCSTASMGLSCSWK